MGIMPNTLEETIKVIQEEMRKLICAKPTVNDKDEQEASERLLGWLEELHNIKTDDKAAVDNAIDALRRIVDGLEMNPLVTTGDKHYANRLNKLINNLEEVIELEAKKENTNGKDHHEADRTAGKEAARNKGKLAGGRQAGKENRS